MADFEYYEKDGRRYERCSTILDYLTIPPLLEWKMKVGKAEASKVSRKALKIGGRVDDLAEQDVNKGGYKLRASDRGEVANCMNAWELWKQDFGHFFRAIKGTQKVVFHDDWGCAGTCDLFGDDFVIDVKTSKRFGLAYWLQTAFYARGLGVAKRYVLRLDKECGAYEFKECPGQYSQEYLEQVFVGMLNVFNYFKSEDNENL